MAAVDQLTVTITDGPSVTAGADQLTCASNSVVTLNGSVSISTGLSWSTLGDGTFGSSTASSTTYTAGSNDINSGNVTIVVTSTGNGSCNSATDTMHIQIQPLPLVNAGNNQFICSGVGSVNLSGSVSGGSSTGIWSTLGSGTFGSSTNLSTTYSLSAADTIAGTVTLVLTSTANGVCAAVSDTMKISITPAGFAAAGNDTTVCATSTGIALGGIITGGNGTGLWTTSGTGTFSPNNGALNASYVPSAADIAAGTIIIKLTPNSCMPSADSLVLNITPAPLVNAGNDQFVCAATNTISLNGLVSGATTTGTWSTLGSGSFTPNATTLNAVYTLSSADSTNGSVTLVLTSTNNGSCSAVTDTIKLTLTSTAAAQAGNDTTICSSTALNLSGSIAGGSGQGTWSSSGDGTFSPNDSTLHATYTPGPNDVTNGTAVLTLTPFNACSPTADSLVVNITPAPVANAGIDIFVCVSSNTVALNGNVTGGTSTGTWSTLGSGSFSPNANTLNAVYTLSPADSTAGSVTLILTSTNNGVCAAKSDTMKITTTVATIAAVGNDTSICSNDSLALNGNISGGSAGTWTSSGTGSFSPSNTTLNGYYHPTAADLSNGSVILTLTPANGCQPKADSLVLAINAAPVVNAGTNVVVCASTNTIALNGSVSGGSSTGIWTTSGSGTFSPNDSTLNGTYTLSNADTAAGSVVLVLSSTNNGSCSVVRDSISVLITTPATAMAGADLTVCGNNASVNLGGVISGGTGQGQWTSNGSGTFTPADTVLNGTYIPSAADISSGTVILTLHAVNACSPSADSLVVTITPAPTVNAGNDTSTCGGLSLVQLNGSINTVPGGAIWTVNGTGTFSPNDSTLNATYTPAAGDNDTLIFVLTTSGNGLCNAVKDTVRVIRNAMPNANFVFGNLCSGSAVTFTDSTSGPVSNWSWNFGNGDTSTAQNPVNTYTASGTYTVSLHVSGGTGCDDSISKVITINPSPIASFSVTNACLTDSVHFTDGSSITPGSIASWNWGLGDGNTSTQQNPVHHYDSVKVYTVTLVVTSDSGCSASATQTVNIHPNPLAGFTSQGSCGSLLVNFTDTSFVNPDSITVWNWSFGDGHTASTQSPSNTYSTTGTYTVLLQVQTSNGCKDTASAIINFAQSAVADYIPAGGGFTTGQAINFTNHSSGSVSYNWNFGDNSSDSTTVDPSHSFSQPGTYTVVLVAYNSMGCPDTVQYVFDVTTHGIAVPTGFTPNGDGVNDGFYIMGGPFSDYDLRVFNEWGNEIFHSSLQSDKWDGTIDGKKQPAGTYIYIFKGTTVSGEHIELQKEINLIR